MSPKTLLANTMVRWWIVGIVFVGFNMVLLYFAYAAIERFYLPDWASFFSSWGLVVVGETGQLQMSERLSNLVASLVASELANILRFFVNDRWVFGFPRPTWMRFGQYHVAIAGSFVVWLGVYNILVDVWHVEKIVIAPLVATVFSVFVNMLTNFLWIWRKKN
ncbi:MAG: GtrA family protein [Spirulina sp.]